MDNNNNDIELQQQQQNQIFNNSNIETDLESQASQIQDPVYPQNNQRSDDKFEYGSGLDLSSQTIRHKFIKKVYGIITAQLALTALFIYMSIKSQAFYEYVNNHSIFIFLSIIVIIASEITLLVSNNIARRVPNNYLLLLVFTLGFSYMVGAQCSQLAFHTDGETGEITANPKGQHIIIVAALMTAGITLALTIYAFVTKSDYTMKGGMLYTALVGLIMFGFVAYLSQIKIMYCVYLWLCITIYGFYLVFDTQIMCEDNQYSLSIDDYIVAAMLIYTDIVIIFMRILLVLAQSNN